MKATFQIHYHTQPGETLHLIGNDSGIAMSYIGDGLWSLTTTISHASATLNYRYEVHRTDGSVRKEWGPNRHLLVDARVADLMICDHWQDRPWNKPYYSSAFTQCICRRTNRTPRRSLKPDRIYLMVDAPLVPSNATLALVGEGDALGNWNPDNALILSDAGFPKWTVSLPVTTATNHAQYKFILLDSQSHKLIGWENGSNRTFPHHNQPQTGQAIVVSGLFFENPLPLWHGAGVAIPVFSLRSEQSFGTGDFYDLKLMIDWAVATGQKFIQILPVNDTTMTGRWTDSYPYNANSTFALHPIYLRVQELGPISDKALAAELLDTAHELNSLPYLDYERVARLKNRYARAVYHSKGHNDLATPEFQSFLRRNSTWLRPYAAFCVLRDIYHTPDMTQWQEFSRYSPSAVSRFINNHSDEINFVFYLQFHLDRQLRHVSDYAHKHGVALKGDIPIGISRTSVDAWTSPQLFNLDFSAGAPPDDFSILGQNWGFPTYNWDVMARDNFAWWKARFRKMAEYFDAYRIDHVLGFFRIWQIPLNAVHGLLGVFNPALPYTADELLNDFDFHFNEQLHTHPYITDVILENTFGLMAETVKERFLRPPVGSLYHLKPEFATQRLVADHFATLPSSDINAQLSEGLMSLIDNVLFIEDPYRKNSYHPRIAAHSTSVFQSLSEHQRKCFSSLYENFFYHRHNTFWRMKAMEKLPPLIEATSMLVCAEDLGMIPACVPSVMDELDILSLEIQRMPKRFGIEVDNPSEYPYLSVCTTSTHDMAGIRQWWEDEKPQTIQRFFNDILHFDGVAPDKAEPWICRRIIEQHLQSPSMLCILPLQDWLSIDPHLRHINPREEQINEPANPRHYWRYRMHITLEQLLQATALSQQISSMIQNSGR